MALRNQEDVREGTGVVERVGTIADLYDAGGRHLSSAEFPEKVRLLLRADTERVVGLCGGDRVVSRRFGEPVSGGFQ